MMNDNLMASVNWYNSIDYKILIFKYELFKNISSEDGTKGVYFVSTYI